MKKILSPLVILTLLFNTGCITTEMWQKKEYYDDTIKKYLVSEDGAKVIFLGKKYHYIFDDNSGVIKQMLKWSGSSKLVMSIYAFEALSENDVRLFVWIESASEKELLSKNLSKLSKGEVDFLKKMEFLDKKSGNESILGKKINLSGTRYLPKPGVDYSAINSSLNKEYKVRVEVRYDSALGKSKKISLTPITIAGDAVVIVGIIGALAVSLAIALPFGFIGCLSPHAGGLCGDHKR
jgi:hypothetical protein